MKWIIIAIGFYLCIMFIVFYCMCIKYNKDIHSTNHSISSDAIAWCIIVSVFWIIGLVGAIIIYPFEIIIKASDVTVGAGKEYNDNENIYKE